MWRNAVKVSKRALEKWPFGCHKSALLNLQRPIILTHRTYHNNTKNMQSDPNHNTSTLMAEDTRLNREEYIQAEMFSETGNNEAYNTLLNELKAAQRHLKQLLSTSSSNSSTKSLGTNEHDFIQLTNAYQEVAKIASALGRLDKAKSFYEELLSRQLVFYAKGQVLVDQENVYTNRNVTKHMNIAITMNSIGSLYSRLEDPIEAKNWFEAALRMKKELLLQQRGCEYHFEIGKTLNDMALNEMMMQNVDENYDIDNIHIISLLSEAELNYQCHAEDNDGSDDMSDHPDAAAIAENMAGVYRSFGDLDMALQKYQTALAILENHRLSTKKYENKIVNLYVHIADCLNGLDMFDEARERYEQALDLHLEIISLNSVIDSIVEETSLESVLRHNIGNMYAKVGMLKEAQKSYEESLRIKRKLGGECHPECALTLNAMGALHANQGDWQGSLIRFNEAKYIYEMHSDTDIEIQEQLGQTIKNIELLEQRR